MRHALSDEARREEDAVFTTGSRNVHTKEKFVTYKSRRETKFTACDVQLVVDLFF